jgi:GNAT superfamily N-acetyltransferase
MTDVRFESTFDPRQEDIDTIDRGLAEYNRARVGWSYERIAIYARDNEGAIVGGLVGEIFWDWLHVATLWIDDAYRGRDVGTELLRRAEEMALSRGITRSHVETTSFQAPGFYAKNGYEVYGQFEKPVGHTWYYLKKENLGAPRTGA